MVEKGDLYKREEAQVAKISDGASCTPSFIARDILGLKEVKGLTIVDLASGTSGMVAELIEDGADAYGVDIVYGQPFEEFTQKSRDILTDMSSASPPGYGDKMYHYGDESLNKFTNSFQNDRDRYRAGYLTRLPLPDNFADVTTSLNGISALGDDNELTMERIYEALRITKPGGKVILAPIHTTGNPYFDHFAHEHGEMMDRLEEEGYEIIEESGIQVNSDLLLPDFTRLTIIKPQAQNKES